MAGTYEFDDDMCPDYGGSALCIERNVIIEAEVAGSVVLDAKGARRVIYVSTAGRTELIGLNVTGGAADNVSCLASIEPTRVMSHRRLSNLLRPFIQRPAGTLAVLMVGSTAGDFISRGRQR